MTLSGARIALKLHRFEVGAATFAAIVIGISALIIEYRLLALNVPFSCIDGWLQRVDIEAPGQCTNQMRAWGSTLYEGEPIFSAMRVLPFAIGLLGGVPIVAREIEGRTTQTIWSLHASRARWLLGQMLPIVIVLGLAAAFVGLAAGVLLANRAAWGEFSFAELGTHGPLVVTRALSAFGIGLLVGSLVGRTLPAMVLGAAVCLALFIGVAGVRESWLAQLDAVPVATISEGSSEPQMIRGAVVTKWGAQTPDGAIISFDEARSLATAAGVPEPEADDPQDTVALGWLEQNGYILLPLGVTEEMAFGWQSYDALLFSAVGVLAIGGSFLVVNRRRPG
jgi:hypothetical protein